MRAWIRWRLRRPQLAPYETFAARKATWLMARPRRRPGGYIEVRYYAPGGTIYWDDPSREERP